MENIELLRHLTIGQYIPGDSLVHRLDPRIKITLLILLAIAISFNVSYLGNALLLLACLGIVLLSRIPLRYILSGLRPAIPFIVVLSLLQLLFYGDRFVPPNMANVTLLHWGWVHVTNGSVQLVVVSLVRFLDLLFLTSLLTNTTTTADLAHGMENMLRPFSRLGLPGHELSLVGTIALRFVPLLAEQLEMIIKAQASRGGELQTGGRWQFIRTARQMVTLIVPLFIEAFRRAEDLVVAMEARCYMGGRGRTHLTQLHMEGKDRWALLAGGLFTAAMLVFRMRFPW